LPSTLLFRIAALPGGADDVDGRIEVAPGLRPGREYRSPTRALTRRCSRDLPRPPAAERYLTASDVKDCASSRNHQAPLALFVWKPIFILPVVTWHRRRLTGPRCQRHHGRRARDCHTRIRIGECDLSHACCRYTDVKCVRETDPPPLIRRLPDPALPTASVPVTPFEPVPATLACDPFPRTCWR